MATATRNGSAAKAAPAARMTAAETKAYQVLSAMEVVHFHLRGLVPVMFHNSRLANPRDPIVQEIKTFTSKRKKTDEDHEEISRLEFMGGLYLDANNHPCMPGFTLEAFLRECAKRIRRGTQVLGSLRVIGNIPFTFEDMGDDPTPEYLWNFRHPVTKAQRFVDFRGCQVNGSTVMRTRPIFHGWEVKFDVRFNNTVWNRRDVVSLVSEYGPLNGLYEFRPLFGSFEVVSAE